MSELLRRVEKARRLAGDLTLPKHQRLWQGLESFSGLEITDIDGAVWEPLEAALAQVNSLFADYDLEDVDDPQSMDEADVELGLGILQAAASSAIEGELDRIVAELAEATRKLPVDTIREAREHRDLMVPRLIRVLREATAAARAGDVPKGKAHFFALFLLSEFKAAEAFPAILAAMALPARLPFALFGDAVTSVFARILAQFAGDSPEFLDALIANRGLDECLRWEVAHCYIHLVRDGRLPRSMAVQRLQGHLRQAVDQEDVAVISPLITVLMDLSPSEALTDILEAYDRGLVETHMVAREDVEKSVAEGDAEVQRTLARCPPTGIEDTIEELQSWAAFQERPAESPRKQAVPRPHSRVVPASQDLKQVKEPAMAKRSHIGRNDPCPCGSGKKFKKCCGSRK